eukprot:CAMPEP_0119295678 /NCGR_PEP_ID=MMETSP1329-20130426/50178_1 /TAXON_ID=114041 /ORGANISM="Genus nov. species nov., Strain RCC1024" /LENGTH=460 /DNA_ID=CAMNT_0007296597 /DNA_START=180 /DNA_END=1562 /DNA_ORIENTATION=-
MYEFWTLVCIAYLALDFILGALATYAVRKITEFNIRIEWLSVQLGVRELTVTIGPTRWLNPKEFKVTPFFVDIPRITVRLRPKSVWRFLRVSKEIPIEVDNVEIEGVVAHVERDGKGRLNLWAALGVSEEQQAQISSHAAAAAASGAAGGGGDGDDDVDLFEEDGSDEPLFGAGAEEPDAPEAEGGAQLRVRRFCLRGATLDVDAFLRASKTSKRDLKKNNVGIQNLEMLDLLRPPKGSKRRDRGGGLYVSELASKITWRVVQRVAKKNSGVLVLAGLGALGDHVVADLRAAGGKGVKAIGKELLNATQHTAVKIHDRLLGLTGVADRLVVTVHAAKHIALTGKPSAYVKVQIGKKGVKQKTKAATASANPEWGQRLKLAPVESLDLDLRVQIFDRRVFQEDVRLGGTLKIPLRRFAGTGPGRETPAVEEWFELPLGDDANTGKDPQVKLSIALEGLHES